MLREHAQIIWRSAVDAVRPGPLLAGAVQQFAGLLRDAPRIVVMGAGKAGAAMSVALEEALVGQLDKVVGWVNVPAGTQHWFDLCKERSIRAIRLFQDMTGWTPHYVADPVNEGYQPMCFSPREVAGEPIRFTAPVRP